MLAFGGRAPVDHGTHLVEPTQIGCQSQEGLARKAFGVVFGGATQRHEQTGIDQVGDSVRVTIQHPCRLKVIEYSGQASLVEKLGP